jgi:hypothetical protein
LRRREPENRRRQTRGFSLSHPDPLRKSSRNLDGGWFRAFDYKRWDYWSSSADAGWGAWSVEAGWAQAWTAATLALRQRHTSFWDFTATSKVKDQFHQARAELSENDGAPLHR